MRPQGRTLGSPVLVYVIKHHLSVTKGQMQTESRAEQIHFHIAKKLSLYKFQHNMKKSFTVAQMLSKRQVVDKNNYKKLTMHSLSSNVV